MPVITAAEVEYSLRQPHEPCAWPRELASELIAPRYDGYSLANVPATVAAILGHPVPGMRPLAPLYWTDLASGVTKVVVLLLDALGYMHLQQMMHTSSSCIWTQLAADGVLFPMTSVCPSTTTTALTCLNTGVEPISHGLVGYELWLREYGILAEMLSLKAAYGTGRETLLDWGFVPEQFLPVPGIGEQFTGLGIRSTCMISSQYIQSALSRMLYRGFQRSVGYHDAEDMWSGLHDMIAQDNATPSYYFVYWSTIDTAIHRYGSGGGYWQAELQNVTRTMQERFLEPLSPAERRGVLFVMMADHGWMDTPIEAAFDVEANWQLRRELLGPASGEARSAYLHCLNGVDSAVQDRVQTALGLDYVVVNSALAQQAGLWGTAAPMAEIQARLGHLLVLSRGQHYLDRQGKRNRLRGRHGGLSPEEMLVPWLAMRLDG